VASRPNQPSRMATERGQKTLGTASELVNAATKWLIGSLGVVGGHAQADDVRAERRMIHAGSPALGGRRRAQRRQATRASIRIESFGTLPPRPTSVHPRFMEAAQRSAVDRGQRKADSPAK
jgi:hypothetical protein